MQYVVYLVQMLLDPLIQMSLFNANSVHGPTICYYIALWKLVKKPFNGQVKNRSTAVIPIRLGMP